MWLLRGSVHSAARQMGRYHFVIYMVLCITLAAVQMEEVAAMLVKKSAHQYCGDNLSKQLSVVCMGNYNTLSNSRLTKRESGIFARPPYPLWSREEANSFLRSRRRVRRGIVEECCVQSCTLDELRSYCTT